MCNRLQFQFVYRGILLISLLLCPALPVLGWSGSGHMTIASMAYRALPDSVKIAYTELLRHHPDFSAWHADFESLDLGIDLGEYLFMRASLWPDEIRRSGGPYNHPTWHYTNFPVIPGDTAFHDTLTPEDDVLFAISQSEIVLKDETAGLEERAAALSWLLHVIGDIHQPLHCVALVTEAYPEGDRGGNDFFVRPASSRNPINLHAFWDGLLGTSGDVRAAHNQATFLWQSFSPEVLRYTDPTLNPRDWALEGRQTAIESVYLNGVLQGATPDARDEAAALPGTYRRQARAVAQEKAVIAASRMFRFLLAAS